MGKMKEQGNDVTLKNGALSNIP